MFFSCDGDVLPNLIFKWPKMVGPSRIQLKTSYQTCWGDRTRHDQRSYGLAWPRIFIRWYGNQQRTQRNLFSVAICSFQPEKCIQHRCAFFGAFFFFVFSSNQKWFRWRFTNVNSLHQQRRMKERRVWKAIFGKCWPSTGGQWHKQQSPDHGPTQNNHDWEFIGRLHKWMDAHACSWGLNKHLNAIFQQALATKHIVFVFYIVEKNKKEQFRAAHIKNLRMKKKKMRDKQKWNENLPCAVPTHWSRNDANLHWHSAHKHWGYTGPNSNSLSVNLIFFRSNKETK